MQITVDFTNKNGVARQRSATFGTAAIDRACKVLGYPESVENKAAQRQLELKQAEFFGLDPNDPARTSLVDEIRTLQALATTPIENPVSKEQFVVSKIREFLVEIQIDTKAISEVVAEAQRTAEQSLKTEAEADIGFAE